MTVQDQMLRLCPSDTLGVETFASRNFREFREYCPNSRNFRRQKFYIDRFAKVYAREICQFFLFFFLQTCWLLLPALDNALILAMASGKGSEIINMESAAGITFKKIINFSVHLRKFKRRKYCESLCSRNAQISRIFRLAKVFAPKVFNKSTIPHKNIEKFYRKVAFLMYTEMAKFRSQSRETASKRKPYRGLGTR